VIRPNRWSRSEPVSNFRFEIFTDRVGSHLLLTPRRGWDLTHAVLSGWVWTRAGARGRSRFRRREVWLPACAIPWIRRSLPAPPGGCPRLCMDASVSRGSARRVLPPRRIRQRRPVQRACLAPNAGARTAAARVSGWTAGTALAVRRCVAGLPDEAERWSPRQICTASVLTLAAFSSPARPPRGAAPAPGAHSRMPGSRCPSTGCRRPPPIRARRSRNATRPSGRCRR